jgi:hypothetical protein
LLEPLARINHIRREEKPRMADYPQQYIKKLDAAATGEAWPLIGLILLDMVATFAGLYIIGELANRLF